eukprot:3090056-Alexandrium_andersonii.AAC.1
MRTRQQTVPCSPRLRTTAVDYPTATHPLLPPGIQLLLMDNGTWTTALQAAAISLELLRAVSCAPLWGGLRSPHRPNKRHRCSSETLLGEVRRLATHPGKQHRILPRDCSKLLATAQSGSERC